MKCRDCGAEVVAQAIFCQKCGARVDAQAGWPSDEAMHPSDAQSGAPAGEAGEPTPDARSPVAPAPSPLSPRDKGDDTETFIWQGGYSPKAMIGAWIAAGAATVLLIVIAIVAMAKEYDWRYVLSIVLGALVLLWGYELALYFYRRLDVGYRLTNQRFVHQSGVLRRVTNRVEVIDIDDVTFEQGFVERFVGVGTIRIVSSDRTDPELTIRGIDNVAKVAGQIDDARRVERVRRGLHIEAV
ncbi:MAG: zinc ribbon domain-containing protein [Pirellulales bacterium]